MKKEDVIYLCLGFWAIVTLPFIAVGYGYSLSAKDFFITLAMGIFRVDKEDGVSSNIFFTGPWIIIFLLIMLKICLRISKSKIP